MASNSDFEVDLTNCDREPIHALGAVQPFGFLLALSVDWLIRRVSANAEQFLEKPADDLLGTSAIPLLGEHAVHTLRNRLAMLRGGDAVERVFGLRIASGRCFDFALHMIGDTIVLEGEDCSEDASTDIGSAIRAMMARLDETADAAAFYREGARQVRALTGFDRVMVYRFDRDGSGVVVAEAARTGIGSFLDLRYPASDIPQQARKLYVRTPFRIIADVNAEPVPVLPRLDERGAPIDLSLSVLRSVSPIHIEYLKNMGVGASLSISIIVEGQLWGLFACHHYAARCPSFERRSIAELFGQMFALKLESRERKELAAYELAARSASDRLLAAVAGDSTLLDNPEWLGTMMRETVPCDGIAIWLDGKVSSSGMTPPAAAFSAITRRLNAMAAGRIFSTDRLADTLPAAADYDDVAAGLLAIPISRRPRDYVLLFRQEKIRTVKWAGDPHKPAQLGPNGPRLTPRKSFELWSQEVRGRSEPFSNAELRVAEMLRASLIEVVLRLSDEAQEERRRFSERQELLIAELNHRVRNILSLIRGLVRQSLDPEADARNTIHLLEGRIESLARAHDQITQDNWSAAPLLRLIETEAAAYLAGKAGRVETDGPAVLLHPQAFSALALVLHELMTNSAKYGALSDSGSVDIGWRIERDGDLAIAWRERGGPAVQPPKRQGFGTTIITRSIPYDLGGRADVRYPLTGLEADFRVPARYIEIDPSRAGHPAAPSAPAPGTAVPKLLSGVVLLVEDSLIIAMDAEDILTRLGAHRVVTAGTLAQAREEIARETFEAAVLDVNLGAETSLPLADDLIAAQVPFLFATGYGEQLKLPGEHAAALVTQKPYTLASISRALSDLLSM
ncbi:GAF domain-containing protein [Nostoc ellipsosporum NOK]|uniref:HWE histidine kinase domain-containing protein n=1 Tax=Sphingomonas sp. IBVSS2 TaxID=1985172 RepID=UPI000A2DBABB|nr:HWE histidine kinase domain-containing protein [Sphingomonas sp. IBVSS2]MDF2386099.1 GAF domain-containing protein [Nostoc ellipsosporum NOK]OSZ64388.1 two-component system sensor histidine kinase/response regulator [Sphingomonas sp. IBVSS2]